MAAQVPPAAQQPAAQQPQVPFALHPATVTNDPLDYRQPSAQKLYNKAVEALPDEYDCTSLYLKIFLYQLANRAITAGWNGILNIPEDVNNPLINLHSLLDSYYRVVLQLLDAGTRRPAPFDLGSGTGKVLSAAALGHAD